MYFYIKIYSREIEKFIFTIKPFDYSYFFNNRFITKECYYIQQEVLNVDNHIYKICSGDFEIKNGTN